MGPRPLLIAGVCAALIGIAGADELMRLGDAPPEIRRALAAERDLRGLEVVGLSIQRRDLDHDGREEWLVAAQPRDGTGLAAVNRPTWIFGQEAGRWRQRLYLGSLVQVEVVVSPPHDALRALAKDGARLRCTLYRWQRDRYEAAPCPAPDGAGARR